MISYPPSLSQYITPHLLEKVDKSEYNHEAIDSAGKSEIDASVEESHDE